LAQSRGPKHSTGDDHRNTDQPVKHHVQKNLSITLRTFGTRSRRVRFKLMKTHCFLNEPIELRRDWGKTFTNSGRRP
jgi:hypothetical protein